MNWDILYLSARVWGIQPGEFWGMTMAEWFCEYEMHRPRDDDDFAGGLDVAAIDEINDFLDAKSREDVR